MAWEGDNSGGYAHVAERFNFHFLQNPRLEFVNAYTGGWDALVTIATPARFTVGRDLNPRRDIVYHTMFEASPIPPGWVENMNCAGLIWTPSQWCVDLFRDAGVTTKIVKVGYGVEHSQYKEADRSDHKGPMRFGIWGDTLTSRKNILDAAKAFVAAGLPNANLEIKLHSFAGMNNDMGFVDHKGNPIVNVTIHTGSWPRPLLIEWLNSLDCGIYLSSGEGLGLMPLEMMATGLPVICANNSGMMEYLTPDNHLPVMCPTKVSDRTYSLAYGYPAQMMQPDFAQAVDQIRWAYRNRDELSQIGVRGVHTASKWNWTEKAKEIVDIMCDHFGIPPLPPPLPPPASDKRFHRLDLSQEWVQP